jgi:hypothetical protein
MSQIISSELFSRKAAAVYLHICKSTLDKLPIPRIKIRRLVFYRKCDMDNWIDKNIQIKGI